MLLENGLMKIKDLVEKLNKLIIEEVIIILLYIGQKFYLEKKNQKERHHQNMKIIRLNMLTIFIRLHLVTHQLIRLYYGHYQIKEVGENFLLEYLMIKENLNQSIKH